MSRQRPTRRQSSSCFSFFLCTFVILILQNHATASIAAIDLITVSTDGGKSWMSAKSASIEADLSTIQLRAGDNVLATAPACVRDLEVWLDRKTEAPLGLQWQDCDKFSQDKKFTVKTTKPLRLRPRWADYIKEIRTEAGVELGEEPAERKPGFAARYGLWVMLFIGAALARGIQKGIQELKEEVDRDEAEKREQRLKKQQQPRTTVVVPRRKESVRSRHRAAAAK